MADNLFPARPKNDTEFKIPKADKELLSYVVAMAVPNEVAFGRWHPEFLDATGRLNKSGKQACGQFFRYNKNREYMDAYRATLEAQIGRTRLANTDNKVGEVSESRRDKAARSFTGKVCTTLETADPTDMEGMKIAADLGKTVKIFKEEEEQVIKPLRFLPVRCASECRYRLFVENAVKGGDIIDECQYCKALAYATENGYKDDPTKRLDIPKDVLDEEPENTVRTLDVLSGKVEN